MRNPLDTIKIHLRKSEVRQKWNIDKIVENIDVTHYGSRGKDNSPFIWGKLVNFRVNITPDCLKIVGSLPKYCIGNNLATLTFREAIEGIQSLSNDLGLPIERGYFKSFDLARNIIVRRQVKEYLKCLEETSGYFRDTTTNRVLYKKVNSKYALSIYDKMKEIRRNDKELYEYVQNGYLKDKNILRYELQLKQQINKLLGYKDVKVALIRSRAFVKKLNDIWFNRFKDITTKKKYALYGDIRSYEQLQIELMAKGIASIGTNQLFQFIEDLRKEGKITSAQKYYSKNKINDVLKQTGSLIELDHAEELNKEMNFIHENLSNEEYNELNNISLFKRSLKSPAWLLQKKQFTTLSDVWTELDY